MKTLSALVLIFFSFSAFGQTSDRAVAIYARNGRLISLTNLSPLSDCRVKSLRGKVKSINVEGDMARFDLKVKPEGDAIEVDLEKLAEAERMSIFKDLVKKGLLLRISGYTCEREGALKAISIDRSYR